MDRQQVSIIIPAYNEAATITQCLQALTQPTLKYALQIIVVCNACQDDTYSIVKAFDSTIICLDSKTASKTQALNLGDKVAKYYPRIYLDADIVLSVDAVYAMCLTLKNKSCLATSVPAKMDTLASSWCVRAFYDIWLNLPYCKLGMMGSGVYALSAKGRKQFQQFPDIIADDGYVRCLFKEQQRLVTSTHYAIVTAPKDLTSLIKIKTRSRLGGYELREKFPDLLANEVKDYPQACIDAGLNFRQWPKIIVYIWVNLIARLRANYQYMSKIRTWERDESSRYQA